MSDVTIPEAVKKQAEDIAHQHFYNWRSLADHIARAILAETERCAKVCEDQKVGFLSQEYAFNQPLGSLTERFACDECAQAIRSSHD